MNIFIYTRATVEYALFFHAWNAMIVDERLNGPINKSIHRPIVPRRRGISWERGWPFARTDTVVQKWRLVSRGKITRTHELESWRISASLWRRATWEPRPIDLYRDETRRVYICNGRIWKNPTAPFAATEEPVCFLNLRLRSLERKANPRNPRQIYTHTVVSGEWYAMYDMERCVCKIVFEQNLIILWF